MNNLRPIVKYESLMLLRTWKFWIVGIISFLFPLLMYIPILISRAMGTESGWQGLDGFGPFMLFHHYNIFQIVMIVFFTNDFREKDKNALIDEVMNSRSMTNLEYILGKYLGVVVPVIVLTAAVVLTLSVINRVTSGAWLLKQYSQLFLILNLPALLFATAFVIFISALLRNTFVVFIITLGIYIGIIILSVNKSHSMNQLWGFADFIGTALPLYPSDLVGIINIKTIVLHRVFYLCLGGFFFSLTVVLFYPRLHQSYFWAYSTFIGGIVCLAIASVIIVSAWIKEYERSTMQTRILSAVYDKKTSQTYHITHYSLNYSLFNGAQPITATANVTLRKKKDAVLDTISFVLNPGLTIKRVTDNREKDIPFFRNGLLVNVIPNITFQEQDSVQIEFEYQGTIDSRVMCPRRKDKDKGLIIKEIGMMLPSAVSPDEPVLLTRTYSYLLPESFWYPQLSNLYAYTYPEKAPEDFYSGEWSFNVPNDVTALAPGTLVKRDSVRNTNRIIYSFRTDMPVKNISLVAGIYRTGSMDISGLTVQFFVSPEHSDIVNFFSEVKAEVDTVLTDISSMITTATGLTYPYKTLTYVEIPHTFQWYQDYGLYSEPLVQSGIVMVPENLVVTSYKSRYRQEKSQQKRSGDTQKPDTEIKKGIFRKIILSDMFGSSSLLRFGQTQQMVPSPLANYWSDKLNLSGMLYPLYGYYFDKFLQSQVNPPQDTRTIIINAGGFYQEITLPEDVGLNLYDVSFIVEYGVPEDTLYQIIRRSSLSEVIPSAENENFNAIMLYKGIKLNTILQKIMAPENYKKAIQQFMKQYAYTDATIRDFQTVCETVYGKPLGWFFDSWFDGRAFPGYIITRFETYKLKGGRLGVQYLVELEIKNGEPDPGYLTVQMRTQKDTKIKNSPIEGNQELLFSFLSDDVPKNVVIDPIFSQNQEGTLKRTIRLSDEFDEKKPFDGISVVPTVADSLEAIVVDDLDPGFKIIQLDERKYFRPKGARQSWLLTNTADGYGKYKYTIREKRRTSNQTPVQWSAAISKTGMYDVQVYVYKSRYRRVAPIFSYIIFQSGTSIPVSLDWKNAPAGWNSIGRYFFTNGDTATVQLSDKGDGWIIADAVRFVPTKTVNTFQK
jgi:hypothetical protein